MSRRLIISNTAIQLIGKIITIGTSTLTTFLIGRLMGVNFYGDFTKIFATATLLYMLVAAGLNATVVKNLTNTKTPQLHFSHLFAARLIVAAFSFLILAIGLFVIPTANNQGYTPQFKVLTLIFSLSIFSQEVFISGNSIFQQHLK